MRGDVWTWRNGSRLAESGKRFFVFRLKYAVAISFVTLTVLIGRRFFGTSEKVPPHVKSQWHNFYLLSGAFEAYTVPLILLDTEVLPKVIEARRELWHDPAYTCRVLCKHHSSGTNFITFAVVARLFIPKQEKIIVRLGKLGFGTYLSESSDPRLQGRGNATKLPTHFWLARESHVIHVMILHERHDDYFWAGPITDKHWLSMIESLKSEATDRKSLDEASFTRHAQAFDKSYHLTGLPTKIDSHQFIVPYRIPAFLKEQEKSYFIECDNDGASRFHENHPSQKGEDELLFQRNAEKLLRATRKVLSKLMIPFWLSSGTLLGWYRECDIISHSVDVDIGIWIHDFNPAIIEQMERAGLVLKSVFGKIDDSYEISFVSDDGIKIDMFFFYEEDEYVWNGGTRAHDGAKFKYIFPKFSLCWTEFLNMKVRVPCDSLSVIHANFGPDWMKPVKNWVWYSSPPNVVRNGFWEKSMWNEVIQVYEPITNKIFQNKEL